MTTKNTPENWKVLKLDEIFQKSELDRILDFINSDDWKGLREFLNSKNKELEIKGILPDYIYYYLEGKFKYRIN